MEKVDDVIYLLRDISDNQAKILERLDHLEAGQEQLGNKFIAVQQSVTRMRRVFSGCSEQAFFDLPELVERVLLYMPWRELLRLQQVSLFKDATDRSYALRRKLFLPPQALVNPRRKEPLRASPLMRDYDDDDEMECWTAPTFFDKLRPAIAWEDSKPKLVLHAGQRFELPKNTCCYVVRVDYLDVQQCTFKAQDHAHLRLDAVTVESVAEAEREGFPMARPYRPARESWHDMCLTVPSCDIEWTAFDPIGGRQNLQGTIKAGTTFGDLLAEGKRLGWYQPEWD